MSQSNFEILEWVEEGNALLKNAREELSNSNSEKVRNLAGRIPSQILSEDKEIEIVFAGQYSAGKSTILKVLTSREDIETGAAIKTQKAHTYEWEGVKIIDTPGVHTEVMPDHDEITYQAISNADLLVFVITNELFDSHLGQHFRKLAIDRDKSHEMMLVVNKMRRAVKGNSPEMQEVIKEDLRKVVSPYSPEDFRISFIDAESANESKRETDEEISKIFWRKSGFDSFTKELNLFIREKGLAGRCTTALYSLEQVLQEALVVESTGDDDVDALEELLLQQRRALLETQERIPRSVESEIQGTGSKIRQEGRKIAEMVNGSADQKKVDFELQNAQNRVQVYTDELNGSIEQVISKHLENLDERISSIANSELARELLPRLAHRIKEAKVSPEVLGNLKTAGDISQKLGKFLIGKSFTLKEGFNGLFNLNHYSGTATHETVKQIGHFFGYKFKPWEAVKWSRGIANAGRVIAVAGTVLTFVLQIKEDMDATQLEVDLRESRAAIRSGFNDAAHSIEMHFNEATGTYVAKTLTTQIETVDQQLTELRDMQQSRSDLFKTLVGLLEKTRGLISRLHESEYMTLR